MNQKLTERYDLTKPIFSELATDRQKEYLDAVIKHESMSGAARELGVNERTVGRMMEGLVKKVQEAGGAFDVSDGVSVQAANGYKIKHATVARKPRHECVKCGHVEHERIERIWDRQFLEPADIIAGELQQFQAKPLPRIAKPKHALKDNLLNFFTLTDFHLGMYAWEAECGEAWDTRIAGEVYFNAIKKMVDVSPDASTAILNIQGDFYHWDGLDAVTPTNKHLLDADTRFGKLISLSMDMITWAVEYLAKTHKTVHVIIAEGNHDLVSSAWLKHFVFRMFKSWLNPA